MDSIRDQLPAIRLEFENPEDRQKFLNGMIEAIAEGTAETSKPSIWSHLKQWRLGGGR